MRTAQARVEDSALDVLPGVNGGKGKVAVDVLRAANIPVWWVAVYLLWRIVEQNEEMLRLLKAVAMKSGIFLLLFSVLSTHFGG